MHRRLAATAVAALTVLAVPLTAAIAAGTAVAATSSPTPTALPTDGYVTLVAPGTVTRATIYTGHTVGFSGGGFMADSPISIDASTGGGGGFAAAIPEALVASIRASASGTFSRVFTLIPLGLTTLTATGVAPNGSPHQVVALVTVLPLGQPTSRASGGSNSGSGGSGSGGGSAGSGGDQAGGNGSIVLPKTGADHVGTELWLGGGLLVVGGMVTVASVARRRSRDDV